MTVLGASVLQLSHSFSVSFTSIILSDGSGSGNQSIYSGNSLLETSGSSEFDSSGSGKIYGSDSIDNSSHSNDNSGSGISENSNLEDISGSGITAQSKTDTFANLAKKTIISATDFISSTLENISVSDMEKNILLLTFTVYSNKLSYPNNSSDEFIQASAKARVDWFNVIEKVKEMLTETSIVISFKDIIYNSEPNSTIMWSPQYICPPGKHIIQQ